ncbi:MAG TPA: hypothetical protein PKA44_13140 [Saprospiraceae bacterium]|nr:hypothetical protein [Saprospiraceae bacterium]
MKYLEFLYYKYYNSQVKLGNRDVAPFSAMLIIVFTIMLYYFSFFFLTITFIPKEYLGLNTWFFKAFTIVLFFSLIVGFYFLLLHKGKYKQIIKSKEKEYGGKRNFIAILFPLIGFLLFNLGWILKMLQNQGKL